MSDKAKINILTVDDEPMNLDLMEHILKKAGYGVKPVISGEDAWDYLQHNVEDVDVVLLDRMMPGIDGMEVLDRIHKHPVLKDIPVVMQTAAVGAKEIENGIANGAYYYLTKPFREDMLLAVVNAASEAARARLELKDNIRKSIDSYEAKHGNYYEIHSFEDVQALSSVLASYFPHPQNAAIVLYELMLNALEHGNLGIGYETKKRLISNNVWREEIARRLELPENAHKKVEVALEKNDENVSVVIKDEGQGFNWKKWEDFDPIRMTDANGRGIAKAHIMGFDAIEYQDSGNCVRCICAIPKIDPEAEKDDADEENKE